MDTGPLHWLIWRFVPDYEIDARLLLDLILLTVATIAWIRWERRRG